jgi:hypothetical protein
MLEPKTLGMVGVVMLFISLFTPVINLPVGGSMALYQNAGAAIFIFLACAASLYLLTKNRLKDLRYPGFSSFLLLMAFCLATYYRLEQIRTSTIKSLSGNPFAGMATAMLSTMGMGWGWVLALTGSALITYASVLKTAAETETLSDWFKTRQSFKNLTLPNWGWTLGIALVAIVLTVPFGSANQTGLKPAGSASSTTASASKSSTASPLKKDNAAPSADTQAYLAQNLTLMDLQAGMYDSVLDGKVPGVTFRIQNKGDQALTKIEVTVYFKDKDNKVIYEQKFLPVSSKSYTGAKILKPHYIWQMEQGKFYSAKAVPSEWQAGAAEAKITAIELAGPKDLAPELAAGSAEAAYAKDKLELYEVQAGTYDSVLDGSVPGLRFKIKNKGDKDLKELAVTAYFKDKDGTIIHDETYYPVTKHSYSGSKELKAGQIWQLERGKFYQVKSMPKEWDGSSVIMSFTKVGF